MESNHEVDAHQLLLEAEHAGAAPYLDYPPVSGWFALAAGAWTAALVFVVTTTFDRPAIMAPAVAVLLGIEAAWISSYRRKWGTFPTVRNAPAEVRRVYAWYFGGVGVAVVAATLAFVAWGPVGAAVSAFVTVAAGVALYERAYNRAAHATRTRLAQQ